MQNTLADLIKIVGGCELEIENCRLVLAELIGDHVEKAFNIIDRNGSGKIIAAEISQFLKKHHINSSKEEVQMVVSHYDSSGERSLNLNDFAHAILPHETKSFNSFNSFNTKTQDIEAALVNFFNAELDLARKAYPLRLELFHAKNWTSINSFKCIDRDHNGSCNVKEVDNFLQRHGVLISKPDIQAVFRRMDKNGNKRVTFEEFQRNLLAEDILKKQVKSTPKTQAPQEEAPKKSNLSASAVLPPKEKVEETPSRLSTSATLRPSYYYSPSYYNYPQFGSTSVTYTTTVYRPLDHVYIPPLEYIPLPELPLPSLPLETKIITTTTTTTPQITYYSSFDYNPRTSSLETPTKIYPKTIIDEKYENRISDFSSPNKLYNSLDISSRQTAYRSYY